MKDFNVKLYKNGVYKETIYHVDSVYCDDYYDVIKIDSWGYVTTLKHPEEWRLSISKNKVNKE